MCLHGKRIEVIIVSLEDGRSTVIMCDILKQCCLASTNHFFCKYSEYIFRWIRYTKIFYSRTFIKNDFPLFLTIFSLELVHISIIIGNKIYFNINKPRNKAICD